MPTYRITDPATGKTLRIDGPSPPSEAIVRQMFAQAAKAQPAPVAQPQGKSGIDRAAETLPMVGGAVGGFVGGVPGAALGGAAGQGIKTVIQKAGEIPGAVMDVASNLFREPAATLKGFAEGALGGAKDAAIQGGIQGVTEGAGNLAMKGLQKGAGVVYRGYLKPSLAGSVINKAPDIVQTALEEGLPIAERGTAKAKKLIAELNAEVASKLQSKQYISKVLHGDVDLHEIADQVRSFAKKKYGGVGTPPDDFAQAMKIADNLDTHPSLGRTPAQIDDPVRVSLEEANKTKGRLYQSIGDKAFGMERAAGTEAEKQGAFRLREAIEYRVPEVAQLNARESKLIDAAKAINHAVNREANQHALYGVKTLASIGAGGADVASGTDPYTAAGRALALRAALSPAMMSRVAIVTYRLGKTGGIAPASAARIAMAAIASEEEGGDGQREEQ